MGGAPTRGYLGQVPETTTSDPHGFVPWLLALFVGWALFAPTRFRLNPSVPRGRFDKGDVVQLRSADPNLDGRLAAVVGTVATADDSVRVKLLGKVGGTFSGDEGQFKMIARGNR